jgi:hydrogenase nickel incorporation protein HypA/HybF
MHETDMTKALILTLRDWWESQPGQPQVSKVHLIVGKFTCVEPVSLQFAFDVQTRNTFLEGAELVIQETPLIGYCHTCQAEYQPEIGIHYACPTCKSPLEDIRSGRELKIDRVEYAETPVGANQCSSL